MLITKLEKNENISKNRIQPFDCAQDEGSLARTFTVPGWIDTEYRRKNPHLSALICG